MNVYPTLHEQCLDLIAAIEIGDPEQIAQRANRLKAVLTAPRRFVSIHQLEEYTGEHPSDVVDHLLDLCNENIEPRQFREDVFNTIQGAE